MRLASIIRRTMPSTPFRGGVPPIWDRPDPPPQKKEIRNRRYTMEEKHFSFFDGASPTYMLVNSEIAEGDPIEALPLLFQRMGLLFGAALIIGSLSYIFVSGQKVQSVLNYDANVQDLNKRRNQADSKYGLKDLVNNPWKLNAWPEVWPKHMYGGDSLPEDYHVKSNAVDKIKKTNKQALTYLNNLYDDCQKHVTEHPFGSSHH